jgi:methyltransferase (TIGR00027 family)
MPPSEPLIRNISDTALWAAVYRAKETERPDALFRDPLAARLAGERGKEIAAAHFTRHHNWSWATRTYLFDQFITEQIQQGTDIVVNLAAGLDTRPYRMPLPASLTWIEVDLPDLIAYKENSLAGEKPVCHVERVRLDLAQSEARHELFQNLDERARRILVLTEGLIVYLPTAQVAELAEQMASFVHFQRWVLDLCSPALLRILQRRLGSSLSQAGAHFQFAPEQGPDFFHQPGWRPMDARSMLHTAARLGRLSFIMRLMALFPDTQGKQPHRPWGGVCLLGRAATAADVN